MTKSARHFEDFAPHTLLKHATYRAYIERWARILLMRPPCTLLRIVDACAGSGADESGNPGSPLIAAEEAEKAARQMSEIRGGPVRIEVVAIEKSPERYRQLSERMSRYGGRHRALQGTLADHVDQLARDFDSVPTLFFIDPFGLEPLQADVVRKCMAGPKNEVLLLFADQAALRHYGVIRMDAEDGGEVLSLFGADDAELPSAKSEAKDHTAITAAAAGRIMDAVYGDLDWRAAVERVERGTRRQKFVDLYVEMLRSYGARRVLPLPMIGEHHKYHLVFATKSPYGLEVMKDAISRSWGKGIVGARAITMMKLGTSWGRSRLLDAVKERFRGKEVGWPDKDRAVDSIRRFVLQDTPAMPHQLDDLKSDLQRYRLPGRELRYRFPAD